MAKGCSLNSFTTFMDLESVGLATSLNSRALRRLMRKAYSESEDISWAARNKRPYRKMRTQTVHVKKFPDYLRNTLQSENTASHPWLSSCWQDMPWGWEISTVRVVISFACFLLASFTFGVRRWLFLCCNALFTMNGFVI